MRASRKTRSRERGAAERMTAKSSGFLLGVVVALLAHAEPLVAEDRRVEWLREHAVPVATLDPASPDLRDLEPLRAILDGVRVVLLGEATRGDGSAFLAKTRLIRFLHEQLGFDLLVLECGFYDCARAWREVRSGTRVREALDGALFPVYTHAVELVPLFELVAARATTERPLELAGFDYQSSVDTGGDYLVAELSAALGASGLDGATRSALERSAPMWRALFEEAYATGVEPVPSNARRESFIDLLELLRRRFVQLPEGASAASGGPAFWLQVLDNVETWARASWMLGRFDPNAPLSTDLHNLRDRQMAENLLWLLRRDPRRKVVVWSLTVHLARDLDRLATGDETMRTRLGEMSAVGDLVARELGTEAYTIAITAAAGSKGTPFREPYPLLVPSKGSFEELMSRTGFEAAFLDLRRAPAGGEGSVGGDGGGRWLRRGFIARPVSYVELFAIWPRHLDGLLFVHTMQPARRLGRLRSE